MFDQLKNKVGNDTMAWPQEQDRVRQQIYMFNAHPHANKQQAIMAFRLQSMGIREDQILNMAQQTNNG